jgi:hypothetical protein
MAPDGSFEPTHLGIIQSNTQMVSWQHDAPEGFAFRFLIDGKGITLECACACAKR